MGQILKEHSEWDHPITEQEEFRAWFGGEGAELAYDAGPPLSDYLTWPDDKIPLVEIADILRSERYATDYHEKGRAHPLYAQLEEQAGACVACGTCLPHCLPGLHIPDKLARAHRILA